MKNRKKDVGKDEKGKKVERKGRKKRKGRWR